MRPFLDQNGICITALVGFMFSFGMANSAWSNGDLDRQFRLESVGALRSIDNVDGFFADYVTHAFESYLSRPGRFVFVDLVSVDAMIRRSKIPYEKLISDSEFLRQIGLSTHADSLVRTQIQKAGSSYYFTLEWLRSPRMEVLAEVHFSLDEPRSEGGFENDFLAEKLKTQLSKLLHELPFFGHVSGRDRDSVTLNVGEDEGIKEGDQIDLATIDEVKRHPLMNRIVDWKMKPTGRVVVEKVEGGMSFCRLVSQESGVEVGRFQKVIRVERSPGGATAGPLVSESEAALGSGSSTTTSPPKLGWVGVSLPVGSYSRSLTAASGSVSNSGGGLFWGGRADAEVWLRRNWFFDLNLGYQAWNFTQNSSSGSQTAASALGGVPGTALTFLFDVGYAVEFSNSFYGPKGWLKLGFKSSQFQLPTSVSENTGPFNLDSFFLGFGANHNFSQVWSAFADLKLGILNSASLDQVSAARSSIFSVQVGVRYSLSHQLSLRASLEYEANGAELSSGTSVSQKMITFAPTFLYMF